MIQIGNQTSCWAPPMAPFDYAVANGFDAFEWFPDKKPGVGWDDGDLESSQRERIREVAMEKGIRLSLHARWQANPLQPESRELLEKDVRLAKDLGAELLNIHLYVHDGVEGYVSAITPLIEETRVAGMQLAIENTPEHSDEHFNELFEHLRRLRSVATDHVGMCLDLGHANLSAATRNDYLAFVDRLGLEVPIIHLHLHENWGDGDTHLTLFTGPAGRDDSGIRGFVERMRKRNFSGSIIFEQWPQPPSLLNQARDRLRKLLDLGEKPKSATKAELKTAPKESAAVGTLRPTSREKVVPTAPKKTETLKDEDFFDSLVAADKRARSWREKLEAVRELISKLSPNSSQKELAYIAIYLRFLSTGQIACAEDGRHFRPGHHAQISQEIQRQLEKLSKPENAQVVRRILASLPSAAQAFRRAEPLTRIRDIAHRNDIPSELKREIKTTLQNKLHRCAGPEDLETSKKLVERITAPGANYSAEFVEQFRIFHGELEEFFNARTLDDRLKALKSLPDSGHAEPIDAFLKQRINTGLTEQLTALESLTHLRGFFARNIQRADNGNREEIILADIGLEDFAFVLVSQIINKFEAAEPRRSATDLLKPLGQVIRNVEMSSISTEECRAIGAELQAWTRKFDSEDREQLLRLKATIERGRRLAESYSEEVIASLLTRAEQLGSALGVAEHAIRVFCEAEIRSHLVFQLSKIASVLLRRLREALRLPGWDVLVAGEAFGRVKVLEKLVEMGGNGTEPVIAVLKKAEGDEEIPKAVKGILVAHEIPHLSHLGVRARQAGVVFAGTEESTNLIELEKLRDQAIRLEARSEKVEWTIDQGNLKERDSDLSNRQPVGARKITPVVLRDGSSLALPLDRVTVEVGGQKAFGLRKLTELASKSDSEFSVPWALVIPFGVMEKVLSLKQGRSAEYQKLVNEIDAVSEEVDRGGAARERLREFLQRLELPNEIVSAIAGTFREEERVMVRSSANCEDLEDFAGAGLYESIPNVALKDVESAVRRVWASLWTDRAALSRRQAGIPHEAAQMAVIIQQMLVPDYSFVLHTVNPLNRSREEVYAELAVGLGETLASASARGTPYRLLCNKKSGEVQTLAFANFSRALRVGSDGNVSKELLEYSQITLSCEAGARQESGRKLAGVGRVVEGAFQKAQDIEGAIIGEKVYLVQSRPQQGL